MTDKVQLIKQEIERRISQAEEFAERAKGANNDSSKLSWDFVATQNKSLLQFIDSLPEEPASEDLEESARYYLLHEHISPLNDILHQADLKIEMQYHKDIENAFKAGAERADQHPSVDTVKKIICYALKHTNIMLAEDLENSIEWDLLIKKAMEE